jgi:hypothetical protein
MQRILSMCAVVMALALMAHPCSAQSRRPVKVPEEIVRDLLKDEHFRYTLEQKHEYTAEGLAKYLVAEAVDLNGDGTPELIVHGINDVCGPYWCAHWVYCKTKAGYRALFDAGDVQAVEPQKAVTNGYHDLITTRHGSAWDSGFYVYKYDGKRYRRIGCFTRTYCYEDARGHMREWKRPRITRVRCEPEE